MTEFPKDFLWGSSTNAQQFEGARDEDGVGKSIADVRNNFSTGVDSSQAEFNKFKIASDHYHHLNEDIDLFGEMGFQIYRFSMAWTRIFPNGDEKMPNQAGLDFYDRMLTRLEKYNIKPVCTLYAYDMPQHLVDKYNGFLSRESIKDYSRYVDTVSKYFKGRIRYYVPFNEQNTMVEIPEYCTGVKPKSREESFMLDHHLNLCWAKATQIIHKNDPTAKIGGNICNTCIYPKTCNPADVEAAEKEEHQFGYAYADVFARSEYSPVFLDKYADIDLKK